MKKNRSYYESIYKNRMGEIYRRLQDEGLEDINYATAIEFDETANAEEVVGYYLMNEDTNALQQWLNNIDGIDLSEQDKKVTKILRRLHKDNYQ